MDKTTRNYGLDLLKNVAMLMVIILHILGKGGVLGSANQLSSNYNVAWFLEIFCFSAVNIYAMITGYVMIDKKIKIKRIIEIWFQVIFYSFGITMIWGIVHNNKFELKEILKSLMPITQSYYWYATAYFGMYFFINYINKLLNSLEKQEFLKLLFVIFIIMSLIPTFTKTDPFGLKKGYSMLWLIYMYAFGAYAKKWNWFEKCKIKTMLLLYFCSTLIVTFIHWLIMFFDFGLLDSKLFIEYNSPFIILNSILALELFKRIKINNKILKKNASLLANLTFGIYLIHVHPIVYNNLLKKNFIWVVNYNAIYMSVFIVLISILIFGLSAIIEFLRIKIFKIIKIDKLAMKIEECFYKIISKNWGKNKNGIIQE